MLTNHDPDTLPIRLAQRMKRGFTLLEVLIAIALLAAIAALLITNLDSILGGGNREVARIYVNETMEVPLMTYRVHMGSYPTTEEGLEALLRRPSEEATNWQGPYVRQLPKDPWGSEYQYRYPGEINTDSYDLWSLGPDRRDSDQNIGNWPEGADDEDRVPTAAPITGDF
jgi:general secretion pathway protein G